MKNSEGKIYSLLIKLVGENDSLKRVLLIGMVEEELRKVMERINELECEIESYKFSAPTNL